MGYISISLFPFEYDGFGALAAQDFLQRVYKNPHVLSHHFYHGFNSIEREANRCGTVAQSLCDDLADIGGWVGMNP